MRGSMDLRALREYVVGDELRHLHWKATARTGQLMVSEYVDPAQPWCVVLLDTRVDVLVPDAFEEAVEVAASILWESCEQGRPARLSTTTGFRTDTPAARPGPASCSTSSASSPRTTAPTPRSTSPGSAGPAATAGSPTSAARRGSRRDNGTPVRPERAVRPRGRRGASEHEAS